MDKFKNSFIGIVAGLFILALMLPNSVGAASACSFTRTLKLDMEGDDVECLQKYLNDEGYKIANSGSGSPGNESDKFGELTVNALTRWQVANGLTGDGIFGPASRSKYNLLVMQTVYPTTSGIVSTVTPISTSYSMSSAEKEARDAMQRAAELVIEARDELEDAEDDGNPTDQDMYDSIDGAEEEMLEAIIAFVDKDYSRAVKRSESAEEEAEDVLDDLGVGDRADAEEELEETENLIDEAWDEIEAEDDDGYDVSDSEDLMEEAEDLLDDAEDAFDDRDYDLVFDLIEEIEDLVDEAIDSIGDTDEEEEAEDALNDARDAIDDAWDEIEEADNDGYDLNDAEDYMNDAEDLLDDAEDAYDDDDWDEVIDLADEIEDLVNDALDEIDY